MKTTILTIILAAVSSLGFAQNNPVDFEAGGIGADWTWEVFENDDNPPIDVILNPDQTGANTSDSVAAITVRAAGASFAGAITRDIGEFTIDETNSTISIMVWKTKISDVGIKLETASGFAFPEVKVANTVTNEWEELTFDFSGVGNPPSESWNGITIFPDFGERTEDATIYFDNITFSPEQTGGGGGNLVTNGDFEAGRAPWTDTAGEIRTEGENSFFFADVATAGNAFDVNLSQNVAITPGETYTMTFDASTAAGETRTMVVGIGESQAPFRANVQEITLTETTETFSFEIPAVNGDDGVPFEGTTRVIFDMGADVGVVVIDNVTLVEGTPPAEGELVTNGGFEDGRAPWTDTAGEIRTEGDNSFFFADVATAGNAFDVNLSQNVAITPSETYTMSFDASTSAGETRTMVVGIGESQAPFRANVQEITLTETSETFSFDIPAVNGDDGVPFEGTTRVIFDMGADVGIVVIDNVSLTPAVSTSNENENELPSEYVLNQNYPNPFNPTTNISFSIPQAEQVSIKVYDMLGREVATLVNQQRFGAGAHQVAFDAANLASGIYIYRLQAGTASFTKKMTLIK